MDQWSLYVSGYDVNYLANSSANTCISIFNISVTSAMKNNSNKKKKTVKAALHLSQTELMVLKWMLKMIVFIAG